jgi:opacity protein-like surface antigen
MRSVFSLRVHHALNVTLAAVALLAGAAPVAAQGFGIGPRLAWVTREVDADADRVRFAGGQMRLISARFGLELSLDRKSESFELHNQKVTETPLQASLLMRLGQGSVAPFLLAGPGWYRRKVETLTGPEDLSVSTTEFGWHAGIGLEIRPHRHFGIHGDYRYTFLDFKDDEDEGFIGGLLPGHRGSMWTLGATIYF